LKKVFLDELPINLNGTNKGKINWKKSIGYKVKFIYDDIEGEVEIVDYNIKGQKLNIKYNNNHLTLKTCSFHICGIGELLGNYTREYKYNIGDIIKTKTGKIEILEQIKIYDKNNKYSHKGYRYKCLLDYNENTIFEYQLIKGVGCNICYGKDILIGYNDMATTTPWMIEHLVDKNDAYKYTCASGESILFKCKDCGKEKLMKIYNFYYNGICCPKCGDKIPYPNKFIREFINQLNEEYIPEYSPDWAIIQHDNPKLNGKKKYDNLLINHNEVWEIHGSQHYGEGFSRYGKTARTLEEEQENDKIKKELAEKNGLKYIEIDARKSELEWIKNSILNIPEFNRYDLSNINWLKCHEFACSSLVKIACDYWNSGIRNTKEISNILKLGKNAICKYLKQGVELGWCDYNPKNALIENGKISGMYNGMTVIQLSLNGEYIQEFISSAEAERQLKIYNISNCCRNKQKTAGNFKWMYKEDYEKYIEEQNKSA